MTRETLFGIAAAVLLLAPSVRAQDTLATMRQRDRFANPKVEMAAWRSFAGTALKAPASPAEEAEIRTRLAIAHFYAGSYAEGWAEVEQAERIVAAHALEHAPFHSDLLSYASLLSTDLKQIDRARQYGQRALQWARDHDGDDSAAAALAYNALGYIGFALGDYRAAADGMCSAADRALRHLPPSDPMVSTDLSSCAATRYYLDDPDTAERARHAAAFAYANLPAEHPTQVLALNTSGGVLLALGRYAEAEQVIRRELDLGQRQIADLSDTYHTMANLGRALMMQDRLEEAEAMLREAVRFADRVQPGSNTTMRGWSRLNLARLYDRMGRAADAASGLRDAVAAFRTDLTPGHPDLGIAELALARTFLREGDTRQALELAERGRAALHAGLAADHRSRLDGELVYAGILARTGRAAEALPIARAAAEALNTRLTDLVVSRAELVQLAPVMVAGFSEYAYVAWRAGDMETAVHAAQLASLSELSLVNADLAARTAAGNGAGPLLDRLRALKQTAARLRRDLTRLEAEQSAEAPALSRRIDATQAQIARTTATIERRFPEHRRLARPQPATSADIRGWLRAHQALVIPLSLYDRAATLAISDRAVLLGEQPGRGIDPLVARVRASIDAFLSASDSDAPAFDADAAHRLYTSVFPGDLEAQLATQTELFFPASGPLASLPPALLLRRMPTDGTLAGADWLARHKALSILSDFNARRRPASIRARHGFVGFGDPVLAAWNGGTRALRGGGVDRAALTALPSLPHASAELHQMRGAFADTLLLTGADATETHLRTVDFRRFAVVAFATHGLTPGEVSGLEEPALVLTPPRRPTANDDGLLLASEIARMTIPADWVILSACNSGGGRQASAPSYSGLATAFRLAGARSLLVSHWRLRDDVAARITAVAVQEAATGTARAEALRRAMMRLADDPMVAGASHPATWAPFALIGD